MTTPAAAVLEAPPVIELEADPIHPYILDALRAARGGDLDAFGWLESDCEAWRKLIGGTTTAAVIAEIHKPARKRRKPKTAQEAPGRTQRAQAIPKRPPARATSRAPAAV